MDISGFVVASSEVIRLEKGAGLLLTIYNTCLDIHFYILVCDHPLHSLQKILVNHCYSFTKMKIGIFEMFNGAKIALFKTASESIFTQLEEHEVFEFKISNRVKMAVSVPGIHESLNPELYHSSLISYQGFVTHVKDSLWGIYELDYKVMLYATFNTYRTTSISVKEGSEIFASNVHCIMNCKGENVLVCCGLSSISNMSSSVKEVKDNRSCSDSLFSLIHNYSINIFDLLWLEELLIKLELKFSSIITNEENLFRWDSDILSSIFGVLSNSEYLDSSPKQRSISQDYFSSPHACCLFSEDVLPNGSTIPYIAEILEEATQRISWKEAGNCWKYSYVNSQANTLLIGVLYLSRNGSFYVTDNSCKLPVIFTRSCAKCNDDRSILCKFSDFEIGFLVILQECDFVFEEVINREGNKHCFCYVTTSVCHFYSLASFSKFDSENISFSSSKICLDEKFISSEKSGGNFSIEQYSSKQNLHLYQQDSYCSTFVPDLTCIESESIQHHFLVINKLWSVHRNAAVCYNVLVLFIFDKLNNLSLNENETILNDSCNFYEIDDDLEFADLVSKMDNLFLDNESRLVRLHFDTPEKSISLLPGHMYVVNLVESDHYKIKNGSLVDQRDGLKPHLMEITSNMNIIHASDCLGRHYLQEHGIIEFYSVKEILIKRNIPLNCVVKAILVEKFYEKDHLNLSECEQILIKPKPTLCLIIRDCATKDSLKVYIPFYPKYLLGLLPGVKIEMYGFICFCSRKGFLYLKPSSVFGLRLDCMGYYDYMISNSVIALQNVKITADKTLKANYFNNLSQQDSFKCLCFVIKVICAEMFLMCSECSKAVHEKCTCFAPFTVKFKASVLIDDGGKQITAVLSHQAARKLLRFTEHEWQSLVLYVTHSKVALKFHQSMQEEELNTLSFMNQVFCLYCSSKLFCRQVFLECKSSLNQAFQKNQNILWCSDVIDIKTRNLINLLYVQLHK